LAHWEIFVGATIGVTIAVFAVWIIWFYCYEVPKHRSEDFAAAEDLDDSFSRHSGGNRGNGESDGKPPYVLGKDLSGRVIVWTRREAFA
jgi:hypothetical protein